MDQKLSTITVTCKALKMFTFSGYILFWQVLMTDTRTLFLTGDPPPQTRETQRSKEAKKKKQEWGQKSDGRIDWTVEKAERLESSYTPQRAMYWWLTKTWENGNENEWMVWITKQKKKQQKKKNWPTIDAEEREYMSAGACTYILYTAQTQHWPWTDSSVQPLLCV